ncbi:hypothetical protein [Tepidimonas taiwanensis]|nr:hypothetical protein [Tepidimonas taiwanensis]
MARRKAPLRHRDCRGRDAIQKRYVRLESLAAMIDDAAIRLPAAPALA